ncbi:FAD-dependent oxidoreductase [Lederbergia graminis]|uniref:FAD-dependent oxidoreductase n=1 Tax=Lederbergia graminis TaxID=735518 RepID=A0ABW0LG23_9BACI
MTMINDNNEYASYWLNSSKISRYPEITKDMHVDIAIIGGGITGITTAYVLAKKGLTVAIFEATTVMNGTTGHTTAKITAQHGLIYDEFIQHFGVENAKLYYEANRLARNQMEKWITTLGIECDFQQEDAYIYTNDSNYIDNLKKEAEAYKSIGIEGGFVEDIPMDIANQGAIVMKNQARFHPVQFLTHLLQEIKEMGGEIYENSVATKMEEGNPSVVHFRNGNKVSANYVISASHFPFHDDRGFFARLHPERSYVVAGKPEKEFTGGLYLNAEKPTRSVRAVTIDGEELLLFSGDGHKTGQGKPEIEHYEALEHWASKHFGVKEFKYRWSAQDLISLDKLPYIGRQHKDNPNIYVATGFRKWGMTTSVVAAHIIKDLIMDKPNRFAELFSPARFQADPSLKKLIKENVNVAANLIGGKLDRPDKEIKDVANGEGAAITYKGKRAGAYKNEAGELFVVDTTCTHMGCEVNWNSGDNTWDCPCHGSRFSYTGEVVEGPAEKPLKKIEVE